MPRLVKMVFSRQYTGPVKGNFIFSRVDAGVCTVYRIFGVPFFAIQYKANFKIRLYFLGVVRVSIPRVLVGFSNIFNDKVEAERKKRVYINIGNLAYSDNLSGIPRVAKKLCEEGLKNFELNVLPVYPDPRDGVYRVALGWIQEMGYSDPKFNGLKLEYYSYDPEITIREGDWLVHSMINLNELVFERKNLQSMRQNGVKVGVILHDIIAERHPKYFKDQDAKNFSKWLREIKNFDGIFAVSQATLNDYESWYQEQSFPLLSSSLGWFHLGADLKKENARLSAFDENLFQQVKDKTYYIQVSTIEPRKGHKQLLDAFDLLWDEGSELTLVLVGRKGWLVEDLCRRIQNHPLLGEKLFWLTMVSDGLLTKLYANAKGVIVASESEGFGLPVAEAAFYGKPLLLRDIPVFREIARDQAFYFDGFDGQNLTRSLKLMEKYLMHNLSKECRKCPNISVLSWSESFNAFFKLLR